jgi:fumarate reductase subunit D
MTRKPKKTVEPYVWLMFSGGGVIAALVFPALLILLGVAIPLGWVAAPSHADLLALLSHPLTRLAVVVVSLMTLVHAAHRLRFTLQDGLQLHKAGVLLATLCYGGALAGGAAAAYVMFVVL